MQGAPAFLAARPKRPKNENERSFYEKENEKERAGVQSKASECGTISATMHESYQ